MLKGLEISLLELIQYHLRRWGFENERKGEKLVVVVYSEEEWEDLQHKVHTLFKMHEDSIMEVFKENNKLLLTKNYFFSELQFVFE